MELGQLYQPYPQFYSAKAIATTNLNPVLKPCMQCCWLKLPCENTVPTALVIPDGCMDAIFDVDLDSQRRSSHFAGISDRTFFRAVLSICGTDCSPSASASILERSASCPGHSAWQQNAMLPTEHRFSTLSRAFFLCSPGPDLHSLIATAEQALLQKLDARRDCSMVHAAIAYIVQISKARPIHRLCTELHLSCRQLERLLGETISVSSKRLFGLIRYQICWRDALYNPKFNTPDAVMQYGYTDRAHLLNGFKKYHSLTLADTRLYVRQNAAFLRTYGDRLR